MRRLLAVPADPARALLVVAALFLMMCAIFIVRALPDVRDFVRVPASSAGFVFGVANGLAALALFKRAEWGRRLAIVLIAIWISAAAFGVVISTVQSMYWSHSSLAGTFAWALGVTLIYAWSFGIMMRSDVQCTVA